MNFFRTIFIYILLLFLILNQFYDTLALYAPHSYTYSSQHDYSGISSTKTKRVLIEKEDDLFKLNGFRRITNLREKDQHTPVTLRIAMEHQNQEQLEHIFWSVSDPKNSFYGKHLSYQSLTELIAPPQENLEHVLHWIYYNNSDFDTQYYSNFQRREEFSSKDHQIQHYLSHENDYIYVTMQKKRVESLFNCTMDWYQRNLNNLNNKNNNLNDRNKFHSSKQPHLKIMRASSPCSIPSNLAPLIHSISGLHDFPPRMDSPIRRRFVSSWSSSPLESFPGIKIKPPLIFKLYNMPPPQESLKHAQQSVAEFEEAYFYPSDLLLFEKKYDLCPLNISRIIGPNHPDQGYLGEASLDVQYISLSGAPTWVFSHDVFDLVEWAQNVTATPNAPFVHSISWGGNEGDHSGSSLDRINTEFKKLGAQGHSILVASGDVGTGHSGFFFCDHFTPQFPATSPYVTSVGGTYLTPVKREIGVSFSSGGFSNAFKRPTYQHNAVSRYLNQYQSDLPPSKYFSSSGRAFPDVAAAATNFQVTINRYEGSMSGTSAASPVFAAMITRINEQRMKNEQSKMGFLNPFLYSLLENDEDNNNGFNDITKGNNKDKHCSQGFPAVPGWDAVTGLGTPDYQQILQYALNTTRKN